MSDLEVGQMSIDRRVSEHARAQLINHADRALRLFALVDAAADKATWQRLRQLSVRSAGLLSPAGGSSDASSPHLVELGSATQIMQDVASALERPCPSHAFTLIVSTGSTDDLQAHLARFTDVKLPGGLEMVLAIWDPAVLGSLIGQADDDTLHVAGPVLANDQVEDFLAPMTAWWYRDREDRWHFIEGHNMRGSPVAAASKLVLTQGQEDQLVEASVPDQVLHHLEINQPNLFDSGKTHPMRYGFVKAVLGPARQLGLSGMRDLVNFTALCLIYRRRMQTDPAIAHLLDQVQRKALTLDQALPLMPE